MTGAIARTAVNVRTGASSRLAALTHAAILAVIVFAAALLVSKIPLAALAGVLLATAIRMVEVGSLRAMAKATRPDALILVLTAVATLALDLVYAVMIGLVVAGALALRAVAGTGWTVTVSGPAEVITDPDEAALPPCLEGMGGAPIRRTLSGRSHGPHDTLLRLRPKTVAGFRLARAEA